MAAAHTAMADPPATTNAPGRRPLVVIKQTAIHGRVFFLNDDDEQSLGKDVKVEIRKSKESKVLCQTRTADDGTFVLPSLDVGLYEMKAGKLTVELKVEDPQETPGLTRLPKTILIIMPAAMKE